MKIDHLYYIILKINDYIFKLSKFDLKYVKTLN